MKIEKIRCEICGNHCELEAEIEEEDVLDVVGNECMKGLIFAQQEARRQNE